MSSREEVEDLLSLEGKIDLAIPRGGRGLVNRMLEMAGSRVPVLGHTEGVCHVYVDQHADMDKALKIGEYKIYQLNLFIRDNV